MTERLVTLLIGIFIGCAGKYLADKYTDKRRSKEEKKAVDSNLEYATDRMPDLISEMRTDLRKQPLSREVIILSKTAIYNPDPNKSLLVYYFEDHDNLTEKLGILENLGFVEDITWNNTQRYSMSEHFAELLTS